MNGPQPRLHLPHANWPDADRKLWARAVDSDDPFEEAGGAHLAKATRHSYLFAWRRFLGFLAINEPAALEAAPSERITIARIRQFVAHLAETNTPRSVANAITMVYLAARMMMPEHDWSWLKVVKTSTLCRRARSCSGWPHHHQRRTPRSRAAADGRKPASSRCSNENERCGPIS